ncbi:MAG: capsule biosynthesis protein [Wohlfahrtiimonas sp.]
MCISYWQEFVDESRRILLLQGPIGPYFFQLSQFLQKQGKEVYKLNFNGGDMFYYPSNNLTATYYDSVDDFSKYLTEFIHKNKIDAVVCFGHKRVYHDIAKQVCKDLGDQINFWSFEEGYLRPHYITFEKWGVNSASVLPRDAQFYLDNEQNISELRESRLLVASFGSRFWLAMHYYMAMYFCRDQLKNYIHHRDYKVLNYMAAWATSGWRKWAYKPRESLLAKSIEDSDFPEFFIVPLQVHNDSQVKSFGCAKNVPAFVRNVLRSFAKGAEKDDHIIFKHHPMDRGFNHYGKLIAKLSQKYGLEDRVHYVFDIPMPIFLRKAKGMVVINSTSGLSALLHNLPVKALGQAPYSFEGLTDQQPLSRFWGNPQKPNLEAFNAYRSYLLCRTQLNANFYISNLYEDFVQCDLSSKNHDEVIGKKE